MVLMEIITVSLFWNCAISDDDEGPICKLCSPEDFQNWLWEAKGSIAELYTITSSCSEEGHLCEAHCVTLRAINRSSLSVFFVSFKVSVFST